eukprot:27118_1
MKNQQINCKYYGSMRGCRYGNNCRYSHSNPNDIPLCRYYNNCQFGHNCRLRHIDFEQQSEAYMNPDYSNTQNDMSNNMNFSQASLATMNYTPIIYPMIDIPMKQATTIQHLCNETTQMMTYLPQMVEQVDLSTFKQPQNVECGKSNYKKCKSMTRLFVSLKYYSTLNIIENNNDAERFRKFMNDIYYEVINDYIHFNNNHTHELENINND